MKSRYITICQKFAAGFGLLGVLVVTGCERPATGGPDYRVQHKLTAEERVFSLNLSVAEADRTFGAGDATRIRQFAREYLRRGRGPFLVARADDDQASSRNAFDRIAAVLMSEGVPRHRVYFQLRRGQENPSNLMFLSYSGYAARLPECGDWSGETGFAPSNEPHTDFGCSYQRNFGLMLANPGDLNVAREAPYGEAVRTDHVVKTYRSGKDTMGRGAPILEAGEFSDVK